MNEAYVTLRAPLGNGLQFRLGYFSTPLGYGKFTTAIGTQLQPFWFTIEPRHKPGSPSNHIFTPTGGSVLGAWPTTIPPSRKRPHCGQRSADMPYWLSA